MTVFQPVIAAVGCSFIRKMCNVTQTSSFKLQAVHQCDRITESSSFLPVRLAKILLVRRLMPPSPSQSFPTKILLHIFAFASNCFNPSQEPSIDVGNRSRRSKDFRIKKAVSFEPESLGEVLLSRALPLCLLAALMISRKQFTASLNTNCLNT